MTGKKLLLAMSFIDPKFIQESEQALPAGKAPSPGGNPIRRSRLPRKLWLIAAILALMLLLVGCAVIYASILFGSPAEMISTLYGERAGFASAPPTEVSDPQKPGSVYMVPGYEKEPVEETVARELEKWVSPVGKSIVSEGLTLTVDAFLYDGVTQSGLITMLLEHDTPIPEEELLLGYNGEISGMPVQINQYGRAYLIPEKTTPTQLAFTYYFRMDKFSGDNLSVSFPDFDEKARIDALDALREEEIPKIRQRLLEELTPEEAARKCQEAYGFSGYTGRYDDYYLLAANEFDTAHAQEYHSQSGTELAGTEQALKEELTPEEAMARLKALWGEALVEEKLADLEPAEAESYVYSHLAKRLYDQTHTEGKIFISLPDSMALPNQTFGDGDVLVNALCIRVNSDKYAGEGGSPSRVILHRKDGTSFVVRNENTENVLFCRGIEGGNALYMLGSAINIDSIQSVEVAGRLASATLEADAG